jgi:hypothetical protein
MSPSHDKTVPELVEKYVRDSQTRNLDRPLLRRIIRKEHPDLFLNNPSNLKKLDRYLKKAYSKAKDQTYVMKSTVSGNPPLEPSPLGGPLEPFFSSFINIGEILRKETLLWNKELDKKLEKNRRIAKPENKASQSSRSES